MQVKQNVGEFMVLNAGAYHCGFNQGFNCAEAVNFATQVNVVQEIMLKLSVGLAWSRPSPFGAEELYSARVMPEKVTWYCPDLEGNWNNVTLHP